MQLNIHQAKAQMSMLVERAAKGQTSVIAKGGKPVARLVPLKSKRKRRKLGVLDGHFKIPADFDAPLPRRELARFLGRR